MSWPPQKTGRRVISDLLLWKTSFAGNVTGSFYNGMNHNTYRSVSKNSAEVVFLGDGVTTKDPRDWTFIFFRFFFSVCHQNVALSWNAIASKRHFGFREIA